MFKILDKVIDLVFPSDDITPPNYLAYVEWFTPLPSTPDPVNHMYKVSRMFDSSMRRASIIPLEVILCSVHLFPRLTPNPPHDWVSSSVLEHCPSFYVNPFSNRNSYLTFA